MYRTGWSFSNSFSRPHRAALAAPPHAISLPRHGATPHHPAVNRAIAWAVAVIEGRKTLDDAVLALGQQPEADRRGLAVDA
jgi:hypothetical protein